MQISTTPVRADTSQDLESFLAEVQEAEKMGFDTFWVPEIFGPDPFVRLGLAARETDRIRLGVGIAMAPLRHPVVLAKQARTVSEASGERFVLGVGPSHQLVVEFMLGLSYARPAARMREYVEVLQALAKASSVAYRGDFYTANITLDITNGDFDVYMAALAPLMLKVAGELADGVVLWMSAPEHIRKTIVPHLEAAADAAARARPRIVAGFPVCVADDTTAARERAAVRFAVYGQLPNYQKAFEAAGVSGPADVAIIGSAQEVAGRLRELADLGVDEFMAWVFPVGEDAEASVRHTREVLMSITL